MKRKTILALLLAIMMLLSAGTSLAWGDKGWYLEPELDKFGTETGYNNVVYAFSGKDSRKSEFSGTIAFNASTWTICIDGEDGKTVSFAEQLVGGYSISLKVGKNVTENLENAATFGDSIVLPIGSNRTADLAIALLQGQDVILLLEGDYSPTYTLTLPGKGFSEQWYNRACALYELKEYAQAEEEFAILASYNYSGAAAQVQKCEDALYGPDYAVAKALYDAGKFEQAMAAFKKLDTYSESKTQVKNCQEAINSRDYAAAKALFDSGKYEQAMAAFEKLGTYSDSKTQVANCEEAINRRDYAAAKALYDAGKYEQAMAAFEKLGSYSDSKTQVANCEEAINNRDYLAAKALRETGKYEEAAAAFEKLGTYSDSATQITETKYQQAKALLTAKDYAGAYAIFTTINEYKDVDTLLSTDDNLHDVPLQPGKYVTFGSYGGETISWKILEKYEDGTCLLISEKGLDAKPYNTTRNDVTWETCTLRKWLNGEFLNSAFTAEERGKIVLSKVTNPDNKEYGTEGGKDTEDYVYLLSLDEVGQYFKVDPYNMKGGKSEALICMPTDTAVKNGAWLFSQEDANSWQKNCSYPLKAGACLWWLRSPGYYCSSAAYVFNAGSVFYSGNLVYDTHVCVRPVVRARL